MRERANPERSPRRLPMLRKSIVLSCAAVLAAIPLALAACGSDDSDSDTTAASPTTTAEETTASGGGGGETVNLSESEFKIDPSEVTTKAGTVTFDISNDGSTVHNLEIEGNGVEETSDDIQGGQSAQLTVDLKPGTYEMYCAIPGHREQGMEGEITVQ
jgi:uncharacterized cupredoxin-like copper-binding protein